MKLRTQIIALCDYATLSRENKLSINGIFDEARVTKLPGGLARAFLVAALKGEPEKSYKLTIKLETDNGSTKGFNNLDITTQTGNNGKNNLLIELVGLGFEKEGEYRFVIYHGDDEIGSTELKVVHIKQNQQTTYKLPN